MINQGSPVTNFDEFCKKYGSETVSLLVGRFIRLSPDFEEGADLARKLGEAMADLETAIREYQRTGKVSQS